MENGLLSHTQVESEMEKLKFLEEIERDAARRNEERKDREAVAQNLRKYIIKCFVSMSTNYCFWFNQLSHT